MNTLVDIFSFEKEKKNLENFNNLVKLPVKHSLDLSQLFEDFIFRDEYVFVSYGMFNFPTEKICYSRNYYDCCALSLIGGGFGTLSHFDADGDLPTKCDSPSIYVNKMIDSMLQKVNHDEIVAIPMGGIESHFDKIIEILNKRKIPIKNYFFDNYYGKNLSESERKFVCQKKSVLINPSTKSVFIKANFFGHRSHIFQLMGSE